MLSHYQGVRKGKSLTCKRRRERGSQPSCLWRKAWKCVSSAPQRLEKSHHRNPIWLPTGWGCCSWVLELPGALGVLADIPEPCRASSQVQPSCRWLSPPAQGQDQPRALPQLPLLKTPLHSVSDAHNPFVFKHSGSSARKMPKLLCPAWSLPPIPTSEAFPSPCRVNPATSPRIYCPALSCC